MDVLGVVRARREGAVNKQERWFYDFTINGKPLLSRLPPHDHVGVFGWLSREDERRYARQLLLKEPSELQSGHVPLYVCPECADLGCGALTVEVSFRDDDCVVWSSFGWDNPWDGKRLIAASDAPRDLWFDRTQYVNALAGFL